MKKLLIACAVASLTASVHAGEIYGGLGTLGLNVGYGHQIGSGTGRVEFNGFNYSKDYSSNGTNYDAKLKLSSIGALYDFFPWQGGFRLTAGVIAGDNKLSGNASPTGGTITINGVAVPAAGETLGLTVKWPSAMPYLGVGWGHNANSKGWGVYADGGIAFGKPKVSLTATPTLTAAAVAAGTSIEAERQRIQNDLDDLKIYPVVKLGVRYNF